MAGSFGFSLSLRVRRTQGRETTVSPDQNNGRGELPPGREPFFSRAIDGRAARRPGGRGGKRRGHDGHSQRRPGQAGCQGNGAGSQLSRLLTHTLLLPAPIPLRTQPSNASAFAPLPPHPPPSVLRRSNGPQANTQPARPPKNHAIGTNTPARAARLGSGRKQASKQAKPGAGRRRASLARGKEGLGGGKVLSRWPSLLFACLTSGVSRRRGV